MNRRFALTFYNINLQNPSDKRFIVSEHHSKLAHKICYNLKIYESCQSSGRSVKMYCLF
jgi:hypothetical protein